MHCIVLDTVLYYNCISLYAIVLYDIALYYNNGGAW